MFYSIRHLTKFRYSAPVSESIMELRMQPRSEGAQRCLSFDLNVTPRTRVQSYRDHLGNVVHHFDVPSAHRQLTIIAEAMVDVAPRPALPLRLGGGAWKQLRAHLAAGDFWEMLAPSQFAHCDCAGGGIRQRARSAGREEASQLRSRPVAARAEFGAQSRDQLRAQRARAWIRRWTMRCATAKVFARITRTS